MGNGECEILGRREEARKRIREVLLLDVTGLEKAGAAPAFGKEAVPILSFKSEGPPGSFDRVTTFNKGGFNLLLETCCASIKLSINPHALTIMNKVTHLVISRNVIALELRRGDQGQG